MAKSSGAKVKDKEKEIVKMEARLQKKKAELRRLREKEAIDLGRRVRRMFGTAFPDGKEEQDRFLQHLKDLYDRNKQMEREAVPVIDADEMNVLLPPEEAAPSTSVSESVSKVSNPGYDQLL